MPASPRQKKEAAERLAKIESLVREGLSPKVIAERLGIERVRVYEFISRLKKAGKLP